MNLVVMVLVYEKGIKKRRYEEYGVWEYTVVPVPCGDCFDCGFGGVALPEVEEGCGLVWGLAPLFAAVGWAGASGHPDAL